MSRQSVTSMVDMLAMSAAEMEDLVQVFLESRAALEEPVNILS